MKDGLLLVAALALGAALIPVSLLTGWRIAAFMERRGWLP